MRIEGGGNVSILRKCVGGRGEAGMFQSFNMKVFLDFGDYEVTVVYSWN